MSAVKAWPSSFLFLILPQRASMQVQVILIQRKRTPSQSCSTPLGNNAMLLRKARLTTGALVRAG